MGIHQVHALCRGQIKTYSSSFETDQNNADIRPLFEAHHRCCTVMSLHGSIQSRKLDVILMKTILLSEERESDYENFQSASRGA